MMLHLAGVHAHYGHIHALHGVDVSVQVGEVVSITDGPFKGFDGSVSEIDPVKGKVKVLVSMFGRDTSVELDALQVNKV